MATQIIYDVKINTGQGAQGLASLNDTVQSLNSNLASLKQRQAEMTTALSKMRTGTAEYDALFKEIKKVEGEIKKTSAAQTKAYSDLNKALKAPLKTMRDLETAQELINEELKGVEIGSQEYKDLAAQLRIVNTELKNQELAMEVLDNEQLGSSIKGLAGGLTDVAGGLALIGIQGEGVEKIAQTFAQIEGLSKVIGGTFDVWNEGLKVVKAAQDKARLATNAVVAAQTAQTVATTGTTLAQEAQAVATNATTAATGKATIAQRIYNAVANANPIFLLVTALTAVTGGFIALSYAMEDNNSEFKQQAELRKALNEELVETRKGYADERAALAANLAIAKDETQSKKNRETAIKNINALSPEYLGNITLETINTNGAITAIDNYIASLDKKAKAQALNNLLTKEYEKLVELETKSGQELVGFWDSAGNSIKAQMEELSKGNFGSLLAADQETLMNATERNVKRGKVLKDQEIKNQEGKIEKLLELIKVETKEGDINNELSEAALANIDKVNAALDAAREKRIENSKTLAAELKKLQDQEEIDLAGSEDAKNQILLDREKKRLEDIYDASQKTIQDKKNLDDALLKLDADYLRDKQAKIDKANADALAAATKAAQDIQNAEYQELEDGYERVRRLNQTETQNKIDDINDYYFRLIEIAKKNGEETIELEKANAKEVQQIKDDAAKAAEEANKESLDKQKEANLAAMESYKNTLTGISDIISSSLTQDLEGINAAFVTLNVTLFDEEDGLFAKLKDGSLSATEAISEGIMLVTEMLAQFSQKKLEEQLNASQMMYDEQSNQYAEQLANREITQKEYDAKVKILEQEKRERDRKADQEAFKRAKRLAIINAIIGTAQAVISAFSSGAAIPIAGIAAGPAFAAVAAALGAAQIGIIASQQYKAARGGIVPGTAAPDFDSVPALLAPGETVINSRSSAMYPELLSEINRAGGGVPLTPTSGKSQTGGMSNAQETNYGSTQIVEAVVSEQSITATQTNVNRQKRRQRFFN